MLKEGERQEEFHMDMKELKADCREAFLKDYSNPSIEETHELTSLEILAILRHPFA